MYRSRECENSISGMQYNNVFNSLIHHQKEFLLGKAKLSSAEFWCSNLFPSTFDSFLSIPLPEYCQYNLFGEYDHRDSVLGLVIHWNQEAILIKSSIVNFILNGFYKSQRERNQIYTKRARTSSRFTL